MTFIPSVLSKVDNANSSPSNTTSFTTGTFKNTTGYNNIELSIKPSDSTVTTTCTITITFSNDASTTSYTITDSFTNGNFNKKYKILDNYYKVGITSTNNVTFQTRLLTDTYLSDTNSINSFDNNEEFKLDSFGKLRVSEPNTILDLKFPVGSTGNTGSFNFLSNNQQICTLIGTGATGTYNNAKLVSSVSGANSYYISQSRNYSVYQPGKSLLFMGSGVLNGSTNSSNVYTRIGYFDNNPITTYPSVKNGLYFEYNNSVISVNYCSNGSVTSIISTNWNIDKMDGSGISGIKLDYSKAQLFVIDMEWLGVGRIRFGFYAFGKIVYCHQVTNINQLIEAYTIQINLPICYSVHSTGAGTGSMTQMCSTVISEGGYQPIGKPFTVSTSINTTGIAITATETLVLSLRGGNSNGNYYHQNIIPKSIDVIDSSNGNKIILYRLRIYKDGNVPIASMTWSDVNSEVSVAQYSVSSSSIGANPSIIVSEGLFSGKSTVIIGDLSSVFTNNILQITSNISNTSDILALTTEVVDTGSATIYASISWNEYY